MISTQCREVDERSDRALAQSAEALRLRAGALEQLTAMNKTLAQVAQRLNSGHGGGASARLLYTHIAAYAQDRN